MARTGRPKADKIAERFEDDVVAQIIERISGGESLSHICAEAKMPSRRAVYDWMERDAEFNSRFRAARARGVHALAEQCLEIADTPSRDAVDAADKRIRIDTRLRLAGKWLPAIYGDRVDVNHSGEIVNRHDLSGYSAEDLDALEKLVGKATDGQGNPGGAVQARPDSVH